MLYLNMTNAAVKTTDIAVKLVAENHTNQQTYRTPNQVTNNTTNELPPQAQILSSRDIFLM